MDIILADASGAEEQFLPFDVDIEVGGQNTFEITLTYADFDGSLDFGKRVYEPGTEHGGIINDIEASTVTELIQVRGYTWRGYLAHRIIEPPEGEGYRTVSGEANAIIAEIIGDSFGDLFVASSEDSGCTIENYQFNRYVTMIDGLNAMLATQGYKLLLSYEQTDESGYVLIEAVPAENYGDDIDISQDYNLHFMNRDNRMGVNHLICLGEGELAERSVIHLYADADGNISHEQTFFGLDEIAETFVYTLADTEMLEQAGTDRLKELLSFKSFSASVRDIDEIDLTIGDTITGRDYITGTVVTKPIVRKIVKRENGLETVDYKIEGEY